MFTLSAAPMFTDGTTAASIEKSAPTIAELVPFLETEAKKLADGTYTEQGRADAYGSPIVCDALDMTLTVTD